MAVLATADVTWTTSRGFTGADSCKYNDTPITATSAGVADSIRVGIPADGWESGGTTFKIVIYRASNNTQCGVATFVAADGIGSVTKPLAANFSISNGEQFYGLEVSNGDIRLNGGNDTFSSLTPTTGTLASPPTTIAPSTDTNNGGFKFFFAIEGAAGGSIAKISTTTMSTSSSSSLSTRG